MPITTEQKLARKSHLGSSDMAAVMGLDPWRNAHDVYLDKTGQLQDWQGNEATHLGDLMEPVVGKLAEERLGKLIIPDTRIVDKCPVLSVNTDFLIEADGVPVEAKTHGITGPASDEWGADGTDEVPLRVIIQTHCHMAAWEKDMCWAPAIIGRRGFLLYRIDRSEKVIASIIERANQFWTNVLNKEAPEIAPHLDIAKRLKHTPEKIVDVPENVAQALLDATEERKMAEEAEEAAKSRMLACMGDAEAATVGGLGAFSNFLQKRGSYVVKATEFRVLRHKPKGL